MRGVHPPLEIAALNPFFGSRKKSSRGRTSAGKSGGKRVRRKRTQSRRLSWILGVACVVVVLGIGLLKWSRSGSGQAALLTLGSDKMFAEVQAAVDDALTGVLPGFAAGPVTAAAAEAGARASDFDWAAPSLGPQAAVRCRLVAVTGGETFWEWQQKIATAVEAIGARVLWGERLYPDRPAADQLKPNEDRDLLRLDLGVTGRPTHTLLLHRSDTRPDILWGEGKGTSAWSQLAREDAPTVAILIDDWGFGRTEACGWLLDLDAPFTLAVLPGLAYSRHFALKGTDLVLPPGQEQGSRVGGAGPDRGRKARLAAGCFVDVRLGRSRADIPSQRREIMLHLPMEPQGYPETDPGPRAIMVGMDDVAIAARLDEALAPLHAVTGINNHMGSAATSDPATMKALMAVLRQRDLFFIDSLTSSSSVAHAEAVKAGLPSARNRIFLDYDNENHATIKANLEVLVRTARTSGFALGIGHPHRATAEVLAREIPRLQKEGVRFVTVSEFLALQANREGK